MSNSLIPLQSIIVYRDGAFKTPEIGKPFAFKDEELTGLEEGVHYRKPVVEAKVEPEAEAKKEPEPTKPAAKGGKKGSEESL